MVKYTLKILEEKISQLNENWIKELELQNKELSDLRISLTNNIINTSISGSRRKASSMTGQYKKRVSNASNAARKTSLLDETVLNSSNPRELYF